MDKPMTDFITLVSAMRAAQKVYFRTRDAAALQKSKQLEKDVDAALTKFDDKAATSQFKQIGLWGA